MRIMRKLYALLLVLAAASATLPAQTTVDVTYTYTLGGKTIGSRTVSETVGAAPTDAVPVYVTATGYPETIETGTTAYTIATRYNESLPFKVSTVANVNEAANFYNIRFVVSGSGTFYWYSGENTYGREKENLDESVDDEVNNYAFRMRGDWLNGFTIQGRNGKYITAPNANPENSAVSILTATADPERSYFIFEQHPFHSESFRFRLKGKDTWLAHTSKTSLNLTFYNQDNYVGSCVHFSKADLNIHSTEVTYTYTLGGKEIGSRTVNETVGHAPADAVPPFVTATGYPETIDEETLEYTIDTEYNEAMPFSVSTENEEIYYFIRFNVNSTDYWWYSAENTGREQYDLNNCTLDEISAYTYCMHGDWLNGYTIKGMNGKYITAPNDAPHNVNCIFADQPDETHSYFLLEKHPSNQNLRFRLKDADTWLAHTSHGGRNLSFWNAAAYIGSVVFFDAYDTDFNEEYISSLADNVIEKTGYPAVSDELREALQNTNTYPQLSVLKEQYDAYRSATDVVMPEDGKAYYLHNVTMQGNGYLLARSGDELITRNYSDENKTEDAKFVAHRMANGHYIFVSATGGDYTCWRGNSAGYNNDKGFTPVYSEPHCSFYLQSRHDFSSHPGTFTLLAKRNNGTSDGTICIGSTNGNFDAYSNGIGWAANYSNLFRLEEAEYSYNRVGLKTPAAGIEGESNAYKWATLYLPYATTIPEGVEAYTARQNDIYLTLEAVEGNTLPGGQAVVLRSTTDNALFIPSTESGTRVDDNVLLGTVDATEATPAGAYAMSGAYAGGIGFYPYNAATLPAGKAYYVPRNADAQALLFAIGGTPTGIGAQTAMPANETAVYDLSGRRTSKLSKGLYIAGGKKVFVK